MRPICQLLAHLQAVNTVCRGVDQSITYNCITARFQEQVGLGKRIITTVLFPPAVLIFGQGRREITVLQYYIGVVRQMIVVYEYHESCIIISVDLTQMPIFFFEHVSLALNFFWSFMSKCSHSYIGGKAK